VVVGITNGEGQEVAELRRWFSEIGDVRFDPVINCQMVEFIEAHAAQTVAGMERIIGCPHEEGVDYAQGGVCPACLSLLKSPNALKSLAIYQRRP
jgi:hypothetical protein